MVNDKILAGGAPRPSFPISPYVRSGGFLFLSGQMSFKNGIIFGGDIESQTNILIDNISELLESLGRTLSDVVKTTVWLVNGSDFVGFNAAYSQRFSNPFPARSTVVSQLLIPGALVEMEAVVAEA